ncbi:MAG: 6-phosphofructokinase [Planctomycetota bacterium]
MAETLKKFDLAVVTGGLGSFAVLNRVYDAHHMGTTTTIFIPASIEGEFLDPKTDRGYASIHGESIGSDTAANTAVDAIDRLREQSHHSRSVFLVECVGQKSNLLPVQIGMACGAHRVYLPRFPHVEKEAVTEIQSLYGSDFDPNYVNIGELVSWIESMFQNHRRNHVLVVLPNGVPLINTMPRGAVDEQINYEEMITSMSPLELTVLRVADALSSHFHGPNAIQVRHVLLDDLQRGGAPSAHDRVLGSLYGEAAVEEFLSLFNGLDTVRRGNLNLLTIDSTSSVTWKCHPRLDVLPLFAGGEPRAGGLDPLPFFRQCRGLVTGYRPLSTLSTTAN